MTKKQALIAAATILLLSPVAQADMDPADMYIPSTDIKSDVVKTPHSGCYIGGGVGLGAHLDNDSQFFPDVAVDLGYQFNPYFAMGLYAFTDMHPHRENVSGYVVRVPISLYFKGIIPIKDRWNLFAKVGIGPDITVGVGSSYQLTRSLAFSVGFDWNIVLPDFEIDFHFVAPYGYYESDSPTLTAGLTYFFGMPLRR